jgi:hypothetical protein
MSTKQSRLHKTLGTATLDRQERQSFEDKEKEEKSADARSNNPKAFTIIIYSTCVLHNYKIAQS